MNYRYERNIDGSVRGYVSTGEPCDLVDVFPTPPEKLYWSDERREQIRRGMVKARLLDAVADVLLAEREKGAAAVVAALIQAARDADAYITLDSVPKEKPKDIGGAT